MCAHFEGELYTLDQATIRLKISKRQLLDHIKAGNLKYIDYGLGKHVDRRFREEFFDEFLAMLTRQETPREMVVRTARNGNTRVRAGLSYKERRLARKAAKEGA
jgi:hypothetical protein